MTATEPPPPGAPVNIRFSNVPGPDGKLWVGVHFEAPLTAYMIVLPPAMALDMAPEFAKGLTDAARTAQRSQGSPLIVPPHAKHRGIDRV